MDLQVLEEHALLSIQVNLNVRFLTIFSTEKIALTLPVAQPVDSRTGRKMLTRSVHENALWTSVDPQGETFFSSHVVRAALRQRPSSRLEMAQPSGTFKIVHKITSWPKDFPSRRSGVRQSRRALVPLGSHPGLIARSIGWNRIQPIGAVVAGPSMPGRRCSPACGPSGRSANISIIVKSIRRTSQKVPRSGEAR